MKENDYLASSAHWETFKIVSLCRSYIIYMSARSRHILRWSVVIIW